jgi:hypothetical protein
MPVYLFALTQLFTVGPPTSIYRHLRFCLGSLRAGVNPAPTIPVYLFITPTYDGWHASVFISTSAVLSGLLRAGVNPAPTIPVYLFITPTYDGWHASVFISTSAVLSGFVAGGGKPRPYNNARLSGLIRRSGGGKPRPYNNARLSGLIRRSGGGEPRPYNNARLSGLTASTFFYAYLII